MNPTWDDKTLDLPSQCTQAFCQVSILKLDVHNRLYWQELSRKFLVLLAMDILRFPRVDYVHVGCNFEYRTVDQNKDVNVAQVILKSVFAIKGIQRICK